MVAGDRWGGVRFPSSSPTPPPTNKTGAGLHCNGALPFRHLEVPEALVLLLDGLALAAVESAPVS